MCNYYQLTIQLKTGIRKIQIVSKDENFNTKRIERELFAKGKVQDYKIIKIEVLKKNIGLI